MKTVTISRYVLEQAFESVSGNDGHVCCDDLCTALGLSEPPKKKVKLLGVAIGRARRRVDEQDSNL